MNLVLITQNVCPYCDKVKAFLNDEEVNYTVVNINKEKDAVEKYNVMGTPITILFDEDGEEVARVAGDNHQEIEVLISQL